MQKIFILFFLFFGWNLRAEEPAPPWTQVFQKEIQEIRQEADSGKVNEAIVRLTNLLKTLPPESDRLQLQHDLANLLFLQGRYAEARQAYQKVHELLQDRNDKAQIVSARLKQLEKRSKKPEGKTEIDLIEVETALSSNQMPPSGSWEFLQKLAGEEASPHREKAADLLERLQGLETSQSHELLNTARSVFDEGKDYPKVLEILKRIEQEYPHSGELPSVLILKEEAEKKLGSYVPSLQEAR